MTEEGGEDFWKNEMTFNIAANHAAKTKVQESAKVNQLPAQLV